MAEKLCLVMGGGSESETLLWENSNPSSTFAEQNVTLSSSADNFKKIRVEFYLTATNRTHIFTFTFPVMLADGSDYMYRTGASNPKIALSFFTSESQAYARQGGFSSSTVFHFYESRRLNASGTSNSFLIPYRIYGVN